MKILYVATLLAGIAASVSQAKELGQIMPLGDSITYGAYVPGGYRDPLCSLLTSHGDSFKFIGSVADYSTPALTAANQVQHEGHSGYIINGPAIGSPRDGLDENLATWIGPNGANPDIILLMIGTNDLGFGYDVANAPARLSGLIGDIYSYRPNVSLYVASITPSSTAALEAAIKTYNAALPGIVSACQAKGQNAHYVNIHDALTISDLYDEVHPNAAGYNRMAQVWYNALTVPEPSGTVLLITGLFGLLASAWTKWR